MDELARFIVDRVKCGFHPYIQQDEGWRRYPPHMARTLEHLEPLHIIAMTPTWVGVDGVYVDDTRGMHDKYALVLETVEAVFGGTVEKESRGNMELAALSTGFWIVCFFQGNIWYVAVCTDLRPYSSRFAFIADPHVPCARSRHVSRNGEVICVVATVDGAKVSFPTSERFFIEPKPENVELFGDLLFLAQMRDGWVVDNGVEVSLGCDWRVDPYEYVAFVLKSCPGVESFLRHASIELVLNDPSSDSSRKWARLVKAVEKQLAVC